MNESSLAPVQAAVFTVLAGDTTLAGLVDEVLDGIPEPNKLSKYVLVGESVETPDNTFGSYGRTEVLTVHTVVEDTQSGSGWKRAKDIHARVIQLLDEADLSISGRSFVYCHFDQSQTIHDPPWRHIATDFRIATEAP